jgi:type IV pilus assembly protein PilP
VRVLRAVLVAFAVVALGAACSDGEPQAKKVQPVVKKKPGDASAQNEADASLAFSYDPEGKPDPFKSYVRQLVAIQQADLSSPLQKFDLSQLIVTGIIWANEKPRALIEDPTGKGYIVQTGAAIGKNRGRVVQIGDNRVTVKETYVDSADQATTTEVDMYLYEKNGG